MILKASINKYTCREKDREGGRKEERELTKALKKRRRRKTAVAGCLKRE
jgi:hypothetical protein